MAIVVVVVVVERDFSVESSADTIGWLTKKVAMQHVFCNLGN
jgi:hypothetical protein